MIYIAATNHHDRLDNAAIRGGRFEEKIRFDVPDLQDMKVYVTGGLKKISDQSYAIVCGVTEQCLSVLGKVLCGRLPDCKQFDDVDWQV